MIIAWDFSVMDVVLVDSHEQYMHCLVRLRTKGDSFYLTIVYGANTGVDRRNLWSGLRKAKVLMGDKPWVLMGDFNTMLFPHYGDGGSTRRNINMEEFFLCLEDVKIFYVS